MLQSVLDTMVRGAGRATSRQARSKTATSVRAASKAGKKAKKKARQLCQKQVGECRISIEKLCADDLQCLAGIDCCELFGQCDAIGALNCLLAVDE